MSTTDRKAVMTRAWVIFRQTYNYPAVRFRSIGRPCFAWALKEAWRQAREAARIAAIPPEVKAARSTELQRTLALLPYRADYRRAASIRVEIETELTKLAA